MSTDNLTCPTDLTIRRVTIPLPVDPIGLLIRAYRKAGLSTEAARRCAVADFRCNFPQLLTTGV